MDVGSELSVKCVLVDTISAAFSGRDSLDSSVLVASRRSAARLAAASLAYETSLRSVSLLTGLRPARQ
jgi:hypothetical protein